MKIKLIILLIFFTLNGFNQQNTDTVYFLNKTFVNGDTLFSGDCAYILYVSKKGVISYYEQLWLNNQDTSLYADEYNKYLPKNLFILDRRNKPLYFSIYNAEDSTSISYSFTKYTHSLKQSNESVLYCNDNRCYLRRTKKTIYKHHRKYREQIYNTNNWEINNITTYRRGGSIRYILHYNGTKLEYIDYYDRKDKIKKSVNKKSNR